jgi:Fe-S cluster assembly scaffold protein SufB
VPPPPPPSGFLQPIDLEETKVEPAAEPAVEQQEISIEEFAAMLRSDPDLVRDISQQLGIETTDPQVVVDTVIAQMQEQIASGQT